MASKSAYSDAEKGAEIEEQLDLLDKLVDRLRVMYEQYFMGIQKQAPSQLHTEAERRLREVTQLQIRNTGLRYRLATITQKFGSYNSYWRRTLREIEGGRYHRDLQRIKRQAQQKGTEIPEEILAAMPQRMREMVERDRKAAEARAGRRGALAGVNTAPADIGEEAVMVHSAPPPRPHAYTLDMDDDLDVDAMFDDITGVGDKPELPIAEQIRAAPPPVVVAPPPAPRPTTMAPPRPATVAPPVPPPPPRPTTVAPPRPTTVAPPVLPPLSRTTSPPPMTGRPTAPPTAASPATPRPASSAARTVPIRRINDTIPATPGRNASDTIPTPMAEFAEDAPTPIHSVPVRPSLGATPRPAPRVPPPATTPIRPPARVQPLEPPPGMTEADTRALYAKFQKARALVGEKSDDMTYDRLLKTLRVQGSKIIDQYKAKGVEFGVVIKDNKVILKAKPKV